MADYNSEHGATRFNPLDYPQCFELPKRVSAIAWHEHIPFVKLLVQLLRPKTLVKLGVDEDDLYLALCESAAALGVTCYGVDTKSGSIKTVSVADKQVIKDLHIKHDPQHGTFSRLVKGAAADVSRQFAENSIELLHINGLQSFEDVCKDWETWRPKVTSSGVVMFHGINEREDHIGMWRLWKQLCYSYRHFEFLHGDGLGIIIMGVGIPEQLKIFLALAEKNPKLVRDFFFALGNRTALRAQVDIANKDIKSRDALIANAEIISRDQLDALAKQESLRLEQAAEIGGLNEKISAHVRSIEVLNVELKTLRDQHDQLALEAAKVMGLIENVAELTRSMQERDLKVEQLNAEFVPVREELAEIRNSTGYKILQLLTMPFRFFRGLFNAKIAKK